MNKRIISLLLCLVMVLACFAGCAEKSDEEAIADTNEAASENAITLAMYLLTEKEVSPEQEEKIEKAVNELTNAKFKIKLDLFYYTADEYYKALEESFKARLEAEDAGLIAPPTESEGSEDVMIKDELGVSHILYPTIDSFQVDIFYVGGYEQFMKYMNFSYSEDGSAMMYSRIDDQITGSARVLEDSISPNLLKYMKSLNGGTFALPTNTNIGEYTYLLINKEVLEKTRYNTTTGLAQFTSLTCSAAQSVLSQVAQSYTEYVPLYSCLGENGLAINGIKYWGVDENGVPNHEFSALYSEYPTSALYGTEASYMSSISSIMANGSFKEQLRCLKNYKSLGYFGEKSDLDEGKVAIAYMKGTADIPAKYADKYEAVIIENPRLTTEDVYANMFAVSSYTTSVKRSMDILAYLNTDVNFRNLVLYGIEGENYKLVESDYLDENGDPYMVVRRLNDDYIMDIAKTGNTFKAYVLEGEDPTLVDFYKIQNNSMEIELTMGFTYGIQNYTVNPEMLQELREISARILKQIDEIDCTSAETINRDITAITNSLNREFVIFDLTDADVEPATGEVYCTLGYAYKSWAIMKKILIPGEE